MPNEPRIVQNGLAVTQFEDIRFTNRDGLALYCRRFGDAGNSQVVLCLPGLTRNCKDFQSPASRLSPDWQVLTPDTRGRGQSDWDPQPSRYELSRYVDDAWCLLDHLSIGSIVVVGTSLGGLVGMTMAAQQPARVRGLVLNDIGPEIPAPAACRIAQYVRRKKPVNSWADAIRQEQTQYASSFIGVPNSFWEQFTRLSWRVNSRGVPVPDLDPAVITTLKRNYLRDRILNCFRRLTFRSTPALPLDTWAAFRECKAPMMLIRGAVSDVTDASLVLRMLRARPAMQVVDVPDRGHAPTLDEAPAEKALHDFLAKVGRS